MTTVTDDLVAFLRARLDERKNLILNGWDSDGKALIASMWTGGEPGYTTVAAGSGDDDDWHADGREVESPRHVMVLFDPARELRRIEADRLLVDECARLLRPDAGISDPAEIDPGSWATLRVLALPDDDHPDYRPEWRLEWWRS